MPMLHAPHGAEARAYRASANRVRRDGADVVELDLGLVGTGDIIVALTPGIARDLAASITNSVEQRAPSAGGGWLAGLRWRRRAG